MSGGSQSQLGVRDDGTLWGWGSNGKGQLAQNNTTKYSSPVQIPGTTWNNIITRTHSSGGATKTDGTLWMWGSNNEGGALGQF